MATKIVDVIFNTSSSGDGEKKTVTGLKAIQDQANKTRESMAKLTEVGSKLSLVGAAITAPFILAMTKYATTTGKIYTTLSDTLDANKEDLKLMVQKGGATKEQLAAAKGAVDLAQKNLDIYKKTEPAGVRLAELSKKWEASQERLGRIVAEAVLPALEKGAVILDHVIDFAEKNPGVVQAALTIGTTLAVLGGLIATTAQIVSTVATLQGLAAAAGIASAGGGAAAGAAAGAAGGAAAGGGLAASIAVGFAAVVPILINALALYIGGNIGLWIGNALTGQNRTWADILVTTKQLFYIVGYGVNQIVNAIGSGLQWLGKFISGLFGFKAEGGYAGNGIYRMGERGREFVLNANTTRSAERAIGGQLSQRGLMAMVTNNLQVGNGMTIAQTRRMIRNNQQEIIGSFVGAFA